MSQSKILQTTTVFNIYRPYIEILTYYDKDGTGEFLFFFISEFDRTMEGEKIRIGDLVMRARGELNADFRLNDYGELLVEADDADQYNISRLDGQLTKTVND